MEKFSKFIIQDDKLILMKVTFHKEIVTNPTNVKGGGWFKYLSEDNMFVFYGESYDFGKAKFEDIKQCVENAEVYSDNRLIRNITDRHTFGYDTGTEIIELKVKNNERSI